MVSSVNLLWQWLDIEKGVAGVFMAQVSPQLESRVLELLNDFERSVYIRCDGSRSSM